MENTKTWSVSFLTNYSLMLIFFVGFIQAKLIFYWQLLHMSSFVKYFPGIIKIFAALIDLFLAFTLT